MADELPDLTRRERDVLLALCRPALGDGVFTEPATVREVAAELVVTDAAVKQRLLHLYDKFATPAAVEHLVAAQQLWQQFPRTL
jgi:hypothetical protein